MSGQPPDNVFAPPAVVDTTGEWRPPAIPWTAEQLRSNLKLFTWFHWPGNIVMILGLALYFVVFFSMFKTFGQSGHARVNPDLPAGLLIQMFIAMILTLIGSGLWITSVVFQMILLYRAWTLVQRKGVASTPGKAVGFIFIPLFNFYWVFVAYRGLAVELNRTAKDCGVTARVSVGLFTALCVCLVVSFIPYLGILVYIPLVIIFPIVLGQVARTAIAILPSAAARPNPA